MVIKIYHGEIVKHTKPVFPMTAQTLGRINLSPSNLKIIATSLWAAEHGVIFWVEDSMVDRQVIQQADDRITFQLAH